MNEERKKLLAMTLIFSAAACCLIGAFWVMAVPFANEFGVLRYLCPIELSTYYQETAEALDTQVCQDLIGMHERSSVAFAWTSFFLVSLSVLLLFTGIYVNNGWEGGDEYFVDSKKTDS